MTTRRRLFHVDNWRSFLVAIECAQAAMMNEPEPEDDDSLHVHRDVPGDHAATAKDCWCVPHVFWRSDLEHMSAFEIACECAKHRINA